MERSKSKREKVRWVALHPSYGSLRPAMPVASSVFGLLVMRISGWVAVGGTSSMGGCSAEKSRKYDVLSRVAKFRRG